MGSHCEKKMKKLVISQPRYLPVISYLQRLYFADIFVFLDNVQRQYLGVENRNKIFTNGKVKWLTIPVSSSRQEKIYKTKIHNSDWIESHKRAIKESYRRHPFFNKDLIEMYYQDIENVIIKTDYNYSEVLIQLVINCCKIFDFKPNYIKATDLNIPEVKGLENLFNIATSVKADVYISGSNGRTYGVKDYFEQRGIKVFFHDPPIIAYKQYGTDNFIPWLCFFDTIFNIGIEKTKEFIYQTPELKEE